MSDSQVGTAYCSRACLRQAGIHPAIQAGVACTKLKVERSVLSVVSGGDRNKDMGGLLQEDNKDFLFFQARRNDDVAALKNNLSGQKHVKVTRHIHGRHANEYVYCGLYAVVDWWPALELNEKRKSGRLQRSRMLHEECKADSSFVMADNDEVAYFKLMRLPRQPLLPVLRMAFNSDKHGTERGFDGRNRMSAAERSFKSTREFYQLHTDTTLPVERFRHDKPNYDKPNDDKKRLYEADFCDRCGIDGNEVDGMHYCWPCWERRIETVSHMSCIDRDELLWLHGNEDERHWRCIKCRKGDLRPTNGQVYEDVAADLAAQAAAQAVAVGAAAPASSRAASQDPATASSGRPKRARRQTQFLDGRHVVKPGNESDDSSNDSGESSASRRRKGQRISMQTRRSARVRPSVQQLWSSDQQTECNSTSHHPLPGVDKAEQDTLGSGQPSSSMHVLDSRQIQNSHSDGHGRQQVQKPDAEAVLINNITAVSARERRVQTNTIVDDSEEEEEEQAAVRGGSQSTIFESDDDDDKAYKYTQQPSSAPGGKATELHEARASLHSTSHTPAVSQVGQGRQPMFPPFPQTNLQGPRQNFMLPVAYFKQVMQDAQIVAKGPGSNVTDLKMRPPMGEGSSVGQDQTAASGSAAKPARAQLTLSALVSKVNAQIAKEHAISLEQFPRILTMEHLLSLDDGDIVDTVREIMPSIQPRQALNIGSCIMDFKQAL